MKKKLLVLPLFNDYESITSVVHHSLSIHRRMTAKYQHEWMPAPQYNQYLLSEIETFYDDGLVYPEDAALRILSESGETIQGSEIAASLKDYQEMIKFIKKESVQGRLSYEADIESAFRQFEASLKSLKNTPNLLSLLSVDWNQEFSLSREHVGMMGNGKWLEGLLEFLKWATNEGVLIESEKVTLDSFLFYKNGSIAKFLQFNAITFTEDLAFAYKENVKILDKLINEFYSVFYLQDGRNNYQKSQQIDRIFPYVKNRNGMNFTGFDELLDVYKGKEIQGASQERVGVFVDIANFYHDMGAYQINFYKLFTAVYGYEKANAIRDKYAFYFTPAHSAPQQRKRHALLQEPVIKNLQSQGFSVNEAGNEQLKAKKTVDGLLQDADDQMLIQRMEERFSRLTDVLLLSGDKDYLEVLKKYKEAGKQVKVISTHPSTTSKQIIEEFNHEYITTYWESIVT